MAGMTRPPLILFACAVLFFASSPGALHADISSREYREALSGLRKATASGDIAAFLDAFALVLKRNDRGAVRAAVDAYDKLSAQLVDKKVWSDVYYLHRKAAAAFGGVQGKTAIREVLKQRQSKKANWRGRLLLLDAAAFNPVLELKAACLAALEDKAPQVVRRALSYLIKSKDVAVVDKMVARFLELEGIKRGGKTQKEVERTLLVFEAALQRMLHVELPSATDWKNYVAAHKGRPDFFEPPRRRADSPTALTLFGAAVTGKNIVFVLDISGSMMSTDPLPPGYKPPAPRGGTVVKDPVTGRRIDRDRGGATGRGGTEVRSVTDRRRITRAKKELTRVVNALPEDVRFNIIAFSSEVYAWKKGMVKTSSPTKKVATEFIADLRAEGITVTDMAMEEAFADLDADTIYLITDGAPTHVGNQGPGKPPDSDQLIAAIHARTQELNFLRNVRIFTLGFKGAEEEFLKKLSRDNFGRYKAIK